jgi:acyl-CoA synthetase (AMP-forming)/AMP-acid ligase II
MPTVAPSFFPCGGGRGQNPENEDRRYDKSTQYYIMWPRWWRTSAPGSTGCGEQRATYAELEQRANKLAHYLAAQGVKAGDHVGLYLYNCNEYLEGMLACFKIRAVPINVNYRYVEEELLISS